MFISNHRVRRSNRAARAARLPVKELILFCLIGNWCSRSSLSSFGHNATSAKKLHDTYSSADFLRRLTEWYARRGIKVECVQTDNGFKFTNRFSTSRRNLPTLFEKTAAELGILHKLIRPYTPRHNGKVERSHREDQKRFYSSHSFYSLDDFSKQLAVHNRRSNNLPMRPLSWLSPREFAVQHV